VQYCNAVNPAEPLDFKHYRIALLGHVRSIVKDAAEAEDVLQEVFVRAHQNLEQLRVEAALSTWLFRVATHISVDHLRRRGRQPRVVDEIDVEVAGPTDEPQPSLQRLVEQREMNACIQSYILDLPDDFRTVILLHDLEGLTVGEIAETLGLTLAATKMRLHRARASLKAALQAGCSLSCDCHGAFVCEPKSS
jgi:RNA polymerase sigma-70 factor, ECF subfamily